VDGTEHGHHFLLEIKREAANRGTAGETTKTQTAKKIQERRPGGNEMNEMKEIFKMARGIAKPFRVTDAMGSV